MTHVSFRVAMVPFAMLLILEARAGDGATASEVSALPILIWLVLPLIVVVGTLALVAICLAVIHIGKTLAALPQRNVHSLHKT